jgi:hypothetical protein
LGDFIKGKYNRMQQKSAVTQAGSRLTYTQLLHSISTCQFTWYLIPVEKRLIADFNLI